MGIHVAHNSGVRMHENGARGVRSARVPIKFKNGSMEESSRPTYILRVLSRHNGSTLYSISF